MVAPLDVFAVKNGQPLWLGSAQTLQLALELAKNNGEGKYFVFSQQTGHKNFYKVTPEGTVAPFAS